MEELKFINADIAQERLDNLKKLLEMEIKKPEVLLEYSNNHIHTTYSFSPFSPSAAVWFARKAGLNTAGIMDHDSIAGAREFRAAGELLGVGTTCGFEARVSMKGGKYESTRLNNPDQNGVAYMAFHSVRHEHFDMVQEFLAPKRELRNERNRAMLKMIECETGVLLDFDADVLPISMAHEGGSVTERHVLFALAKKVLKDGTQLERYDLLGKYKTELMPRIFIPADKELITLDEAVALAKEIDAYLCYAYLGDVGQSPTGDKAAATYEDAFLDELLESMSAAGVKSVTYMPSRNTPEQLDRLMQLCDKLDMRQISGEDINSPRQSFICKHLSDPKFKHLVEQAGELVKREQ